MLTEINAPRIQSRETPRQILFEDFKKIPELPISGGWGYSIEDAVIIDKNDPIAANVRRFDGVGIEYVFVEKRIYEELIIFQSTKNLYVGIKWEKIRQTMMQKDGKSYDLLQFKVTALRSTDRVKVFYNTEYWFDITSFFGKN